MLSIGICVSAYSALGVSKIIQNYMRVKTAELPYKSDDGLLLVASYVYAMQTRLPLTFLSGFIGAIVIACNI